MKGQPKTDIGFMSIPDAAQYIAHALDEVVNRNSNKYIHYIKNHLKLYSLGSRNYQVKKEDVIEAISHFKKSIIISNELADNLKSLINLKEQNILSLDQFYDAVKKLL